MKAILIIIFHIIILLNDYLNIIVKMSFTTAQERPLKMPENYDFSVRNVNFKDYEKYFILRTDAVWEKSKLLSMFYSTYKAVY